MERPSIKIASGLHTDFTYAAANHKYVIQHILEAKCRGTPAQRLGICFGHGRAIERVPVELNYYYELNSMPHNAAAQIHPAQQRSRCDVADPSSAAVAMSWRGQRTLSTPGFLTYVRVRMPKAPPPPHEESRKRGCRDDTGINQELIKEYKCNLFVMLSTL